ncbi:uncharacterized protein LOC129736416 [Falco cherrug]|uniref:uncharacterized protein LOC129736416 n=1 Tax=Falco cherrug TaxID=345164 RepID=UPI002478C5A6|nr:uncharacterized protein LOC129736416 [Falco cherrug]
MVGSAADIFSYILHLKTAVQLISCVVPSSSRSCREYNRAWPWALCSVTPIEKFTPSIVHSTESGKVSHQNSATVSNHRSHCSLFLCRSRLDHEERGDRERKVRKKREHVLYASSLESRCYKCTAVDSKPLSVTDPATTSPASRLFRAPVRTGWGGLRAGVIAVVSATAALPARQAREEGKQEAQKQADRPHSCVTASLFVRPLLRTHRSAGHRSCSAHCRPGALPAALAPPLPPLWPRPSRRSGPAPPAADVTYRMALRGGALA